MYDFEKKRDGTPSDETMEIVSSFESSYNELQRHLQLFDTWLAIKNINTPEINRLKASLESDLNMHNFKQLNDDELIHIAMEGMFENIKGHMYSFVKVFTYMNDKNKAMVGDLNRLSSIVSSINTEKSGSFESTRISRAFGFDGEKVTSARIDEIIKNEKNLREFLNQYYTFVREAVGIYEHWVNQNIFKRISSKREFAKKMSELIKNFITGIKIGKVDKSENGGYIQLSSYYPYGLRFKLEYVNLSDESAITKSKPFKLSKLPYNKSPRSNTEEVEILDKSKMIAYLKHIEEGVNKSIKLDEWEYLHNKLLRLTGVVKKLKASDVENEAAGDDAEQQKQVAKTTIKTFKMITDYSLGGLITINDTLLRGNTILMYYIEQSIKQHNKKS